MGWKELSQIDIITLPNAFGQLTQYGGGEGGGQGQILIASIDGAVWCTLNRLANEESSVSSG